MSDGAQNSQPKSANLGAANAYAFKFSRVNGDFVSLKVWGLGGVSAAENICVKDLHARAAEMEAAMADCEFKRSANEISALPKDPEGETGEAASQLHVSIRGIGFVFSGELMRRLHGELRKLCNICDYEGDRSNVLGSEAARAPLARSSSGRKAAAAQNEHASASAPERHFHRENMGDKNRAGRAAARPKSCAFSLGAQDSKILRCGGGKRIRRPDSKEVRQSSPEAAGAKASGKKASRPKLPKGWRACAVKNSPGRVKVRMGRSSAVTKRYKKA